MFPYLFIWVYVLLALLMFICDFGKFKKKEYNYLFNAFYILLALLVAFRYYVGNDTAGYMLVYERIPPLDNLKPYHFQLIRAQPFFILLNSLCKTIWNDFALLQFVQAALFYHSLYLLLEKLRLKKFYLLFIFYGYMYIAELSAMRESLGLAFCFYAMQFYLKGKWIPYNILVFVGFMFHSGMILFFFFPLVKLIKQLTVKNALIIIAFSILIPLIYSFFVGLDISVSDNAISRYGRDDNVVSLKLSTIMYNVLLLGLVIYYSIIKKEKPIERQMIREDFIYLGGIIYIMISLIGSAYIPIMYRLTSHFAIFFFYTVSIVLKKTKPDTVVTYLFLCIVFYMPVARFVSLYTNSDNSVQNAYCSIFSKDSDKSKMKASRYGTKASDYFK